MSMTLGALLLVGVALSTGSAIRRRADLPVVLASTFCRPRSITVGLQRSGLCGYGSMLRYEFAVHALIVLAFL